MRERQKTKSFNAEERLRKQRQKEKDKLRRRAERRRATIERRQADEVRRLREWASNNRSLPFVPPLFEREREWYEGYRIRYQLCGPEATIPSTLDTMAVLSRGIRMRRTKWNEK